MSYRLINQRNPDLTFSMNNLTWYRVLEAAEDYGWNPMGTVESDGWHDPGFILAGFGGGLSLRGGSYTDDEERMVLLEDALNLGDALERAYFEYEPEVSAGYAFVYYPSLALEVDYRKPGLGVLEELVQFCRNGAFCIQKIK